MLLETRSRRFILTKEIRLHLERRVRFALNRFEARIIRTSIVITDVNGPKGGPDKVCRVTVVPTRGDRIVVTELGKDLFRVIDQVTDRVKQQVSSTLERNRHFDNTQSVRKEARS
jgi:putative sigma-54 modulation protein